MTILKQEINSQKKMLLIWSLVIGVLIASCVLMFPEMKSQMGNVNEMFSSMGNFTQAFGMDRLDFGTLTGFYMIEGGNILGIGGAFFAAIVGVSALMKEERDHTAEFLFSHPVSRVKVITQKLLSVLSIIVIMNAVVIVLSILSIAIIGEEFFWKEMFLFHLAHFLMQLEIAGICFGISAFLTRGGLGIGIGVAAMMYFLNLIANISKSARALKYISSFSYTEAADIVESGGLEMKYLLPGMAFMIIGIIAAYVKYTKKDLR
ncbi:MAG: ABC transporter permease subunit [Clostridiales bacterium]|nr:ABC transporter permease subunit [Clostridiales bacterium]